MVNNGGIKLTVINVVYFKIGVECGDNKQDSNNKMKG